MISKGKKVGLAFELTVDGKLFKTIHSRKPVKFIHGKSTTDFPKGLAAQLGGMKLGQKKRVVLSAKQGYGPSDPKLIMTMPRTRFKQKYHTIGRQVISERDGKHLAFVKDVRQDSIVLDFNHPLAGKNLQYDVWVISIEGEGIISQQARSQA